MLNELPDYKAKCSEIEMNMKVLGVVVRFTPKAHCEIAGHGIKNVWGVTKREFHSENLMLNVQ